MSQWSSIFPRACLGPRQKSLLCRLDIQSQLVAAGTGSTWAGSPVETQRKQGLLLILYGSADLNMETFSVLWPP